MRGLITCGWCRTQYTQWQSHCDACGGPLPRTGAQVGDPPPAPPRPMPAGFARRVRLNIAVLLGLAMSLLGGLVCWGVLQAHSWAALFPALFLIGGLSMLRLGWMQASQKLRAFRRGTSIAGEVISVRLDKTQSNNNDHPWELRYRFQVEGHYYEGRLSSFDGTLAIMAAGDPLWVLYVPKDPGINTIYPPIV